LQSNDLNAWLIRCLILSILERQKEAIASYDKAIEFKPDYAKAFYNRALCHSLMGNLEMALADLTTAFHLNPEPDRQLATTD
jgi:tetratricopeptide (TPR) repeat protein